MYSTPAVGDLQQGGTDGITYFVLLLLLVDDQLHKADPRDPLPHQWQVYPLLHCGIKHKLCVRILSHCPVGHCILPLDEMLARKMDVPANLPHLS